MYISYLCGLSHCVYRQFVCCCCCRLFLFFSYNFAHSTKVLRESSSMKFQKMLFVSYFACDKWRVVGVCVSFAHCVYIYTMGTVEVSVYCLVWLHSSNTRFSFAFRLVLAFVSVKTLSREFCVWIFFLLCSLLCHMYLKIRKRKSHTVHVFSRLFSAH